MSITQYKINELCDVGSSKRIFKADYQASGIPFFRAKEISEKHKGIKEVSDPLFISEEKFKEISSKLGSPKDGDLLLTSIGALLGEPYIVDNDGDFYFKDGNLTWFRNFTKLDSSFLYYWLLSPKGRGELERCKIGSAQPAFTIEKLRQMVIELPPIEIQTSIVKRLKNYDNLIENNNRRIAILEDMSQSLYREWFVNFRYPGHADASLNDALNESKGTQKLIDSPLGKIPEGWQVKTAAEAITINPKTKLVKDGEKPFVGMSGLSQGSMVIGDIIEKAGNSGAKFINGDTLFARITPCLQNGKTGYVLFLTAEQPVGFGSTEFIVLRQSDDLSSEFIYLLSRSHNFREHAIQSMTGATGRQRVHVDCFASYYLPVPPKELMNEFTKIVKPMFKSIFNLSRRNENLKKQRDMLLPKLISGQLELKD